MADLTGHDWTGFTKGSMTVSASSNYSSHYAWKALDGGLGTYWTTGGVVACWIKLDFGSGNSETVTTVGLQANTIPEPNRMPKDFTIQGSNDDSNWTTLETVTNETAWGDGEKRDFNLGTQGAYRYYKIDITANNGDASYTQIGELYLYSGADVNITADPILTTTSVLGNYGFCFVADPIVVTLSQSGSWGSGISVIADPILATTSIFGNYIPGVIISAGPINLTVTQRGILSQWPARERDPALDQTFDCRGQDRFGNWDQGIPVFTVSLEGVWLNKTILADPITVAVSLEGDWLTTILVTADPIIVAVGLKTADIITELFKTNWLKWSNIGSLDFTIDKTNVAGERPLDWRGWVYSVRKLGSKVVVYGENGVSVLTPASNVYGLQTIYRIGLKGKGAVSGDDSVHYFVDNLGQLWRFSKGLEKLDYSEYLSGMIDNLVLSWDAANKFLYICDGSQGYVFSQDSGSLGAGPVNVTGIDSQSGILYVAAPATIATPTFQIVTDIYDLGSRRGKNIYSLEVGTDLTETLEAAIDYRLDKAAAFVTTDWHVVDPRGLAYIPCYGKEFRFRLKCETLEYFELDYLVVSGEVCRC